MEMKKPSYFLKIARTKNEFEMIHRLNYETFVEEIPQHSKNNDKRLVDLFHDENTYILVYRKTELIGMVTVRDKRPFSLDKKIGNVEGHLPIKLQNPCEIRLLTVKKPYRSSRAFMYIVAGLFRYFDLMGYDGALISGTTREIKLYEHLGFKPFAYLTGKEDALYQPMYLSTKLFSEDMLNSSYFQMKNYLPGPITPQKDVKEAFLEEPLWHRSIKFEKLLEQTKQKLLSITNGEKVELVLGSGTLANDMIAGQLSLLSGKGCIVINGEFGNRLADHAKRFSLLFDKYEYPWGTPVEQKSIVKLMESGKYSWIWLVHCETSTGILNEYDLIAKVGKRKGVKICLDCISSIGAVPIDLSEIYLASGVSGKAICSYSGLCFIFHHGIPSHHDTLPRYLDLQLYEQAKNVPFSQSSPLIKSLNKALSRYEEMDVFSKVKERINHFKAELQHTACLLIDNNQPLSGVLTIKIPNTVRSEDVWIDLILNGFFTHGKNGYLVKKNWLQLAFFQTQSREDDQHLIHMLQRILTF